MVILNPATDLGILGKELGMDLGMGSKTGLESTSRFSVEEKSEEKSDEFNDEVLTEAMRNALHGGSMRPDVVGDYKLPADATQKLHLNLKHMTFAAFNDSGGDIMDFAAPVFTVVHKALMTTPLASVVKVFDNYALFIDKHSNIMIGFGKHNKQDAERGRRFMAFIVKIGACKDGLKICEYLKRCKYSLKKTDFQQANCMEKLKIEELQLRRTVDHAMTNFMNACNLPARTHTMALEASNPIKRVRCDSNDNNQTCGSEVMQPPKIQRQKTIVC